MKKITLLVAIVALVLLVPAFWSLATTGPAQAQDEPIRREAPDNEALLICEGVGTKGKATLTVICCPPEPGKTILPTIIDLECDAEESRVAKEQIGSVFQWGVVLKILGFTTISCAASGTGLPVLVRCPPGPGLGLQWLNFKISASGP